MADIEELERYYISNASLKGTSDEANALRQWNNIVRDMTRSLESATNSIIKVTTKINEKGNALSTFDVPKEMKNVASSVFANQLGLIPSKYGLKGDFTNMLNTQDEYRRLYFSKDIHGSRAQRELKDLSDKLGLTVQSTPTKAHKDRYTIGMPVSEGDWNRTLARFGEDEAKARRSLAGKLFRTDLASVERYSRNVADERKEKEQAEERKREEKKQAEERKREEKEQKDNSRKSLSTLTKVGVLLTAIADITRRILTATLDRATEVRKENVTAKNLGITYDSMRRYTASELTLGMQKGTFTSAMTSLQSSFGDITHLDEKALSELAKVMGGGVINAINAGLGKNNPEKLMEQILNTYYERGQRGINSIGQRVGKYQAERELATALEKAGLKEIAEILRVMFYTNDESIYKGKIGTGTDTNAFKEMLSLATVYSNTLTSVDFNNAKELGDTVNNLKNTFDQLAKMIEVTLLGAIRKLVWWVDKLQIGKSEEEQVADASENFASYKAVKTASERERGALLKSMAGSGIVQGIGATVSSSGISAFGRTFKSAEGLVEYLIDPNFKPPKGYKEQYEKYRQWLATSKGIEFAKNYLMLKEKDRIIKAISGINEEDMTGFSAGEWTATAQMMNIQEMLGGALAGNYFVDTKYTPLQGILQLRDNPTAVADYYDKNLDTVSFDSNLEGVKAFLNRTKNNANAEFLYYASQKLKSEATPEAILKALGAMSEADRAIAIKDLVTKGKSHFGEKGWGFERQYDVNVQKWFAGYEQMLYKQLSEQMNEQMKQLEGGDKVSFAPLHGDIIIDVTGNNGALLGQLKFSSDGNSDNTKAVINDLTNAGIS